MRWLKKWLTRLLIDDGMLHEMVWHRMYLFYKNANDGSSELMSKRIEKELLDAINRTYFPTLEDYENAGSTTHCSNNDTAS
jgi:hypothetical protein